MRYTAVAIDVETANRVSAGLDDDELFDLLESGIDLDKMWQAAQITISGGLENPEPLITGEPITDDLGYGPAYFASPEDVVRVAATLADMTQAELAGRFDPSVMQEHGAYPSIWHENSDQLRAEVSNAAMELVGLYRAAAGKGLGVLAAIT
jgi:hypothetical protein